MNVYDTLQVVFSTTSYLLGALDTMEFFEEISVVDVFVGIIAAGIIIEFIYWMMYKETD